MKRSTSAERGTPKKRRKPRGPRTTSPAPRHLTLKSPSIREARASSDKFQKALQSHKAESARVPSPAPHAFLAPAAPLLETPPATSPSENLASVVQKIHPSSGSAEMDLSDGEAGPGEKKTATELGATPKQGQGETSDKEISAEAEEPAPEKNADEHEPMPPVIDLERVVVARTPPPSTQPTDVKAAEVELISSPPRQGTGASADDAMEIDPPSPSRKLKHEDQLSQAASANDVQTMPDDTSGGTVVTAQWLLTKLNHLSAATLDADRAAIRQDLLDMEAAVAQLPRAALTPPPPPHRRSDSNTPAGQRLSMLEELIKPQLAGSGFPWRGYKAKLLALCARNEVHNADYRQRLEMVKEIVYLPEEMHLLRGGGAARIECAVRVCATVAEVLGRDDEVVPRKDMVAWVAAQLQDLVWKAKVTGAWRNYWPETTETVVVD